MVACLESSLACVLMQNSKSALPPGEGPASLQAANAMWSSVATDSKLASESLFDEFSPSSERRSVPCLVSVSTACAVPPFVVSRFVPPPMLSRTAPPILTVAVRIASRRASRFAARSLLASPEHCHSFATGRRRRRCAQRPPVLSSHSARLSFASRGSDAA
jgi:hypothetical protein